MGTEDFQPFDSFNGDDIFPYLTDVNQSFNEVDFQEFEESINETEFLSFDLAELEANLTAIIVRCTAFSLVLSLSLSLSSE